MRHLTGLFALSLLALAGCQEEVQIDRNEAPIADGGEDISQPANLPVFMDGRASYDPDGDEVVFHWTIDHAPQGSKLPDLTDPFSPNHSSQAATTRFQPDVTGTYVVALRTYDGEMYSEESFTIIEAGEPTDRPVANAGRDQYLAFGNVAYLDGRQSTDDQGSVLDCSWALVDKPYNSTLESDDIAVNADDNCQAEFEADVPGNFTVALTVDNGMAVSQADDLQLFFEGDNQQPLANAGGDRNAMDCMDVSLDCSASSDPDGDRLYYWWTIQAIPGGSAVDNRAISNQNAADPGVYFDVAGEYQLACSVFDGRVWSKPDVITLDIAERDFNDPPVVDAGPDRVQDLGDTPCEQTTSTRWPYDTITTCDKCESEVFTQSGEVTDPDGDPFEMEWRVIEESKLDVFGATTEFDVNVEGPTLSPQNSGVVTEIGYVELLATDCTGEVGRDDFEVETSCEAYID